MFDNFGERIKFYGYCLCFTVLPFTLAVSIIENLGIHGSDARKALTWILIIVIDVIFGFILYLRKKNKRKNLEFGGGVLSVHQKTAENERELKIKAFYYETVAYHESKIIYTGATSGGVSMGGFHKTDPYYSSGGKTKTDRYMLTYGSAEIKEIKCDFEIDYDTLPFLKPFKKDAQHLVLKHINKSKKSDVEKKMLYDAALKDDIPQVSRLMKNDTVKEHLSKEECEKIKDWICGRI